ncbi:MAG: response regulator [Chitinophagaceae bacterium]|nr:response regulator [Chitinophagaceae bacterium]
MQKVLIVDDDEDFLRIIKKSLTSIGFSISVKADANNIMSEIRDGKPDAIVLDINLPFTDGRYLAKCIRALKTYNHIPVIMISGMEMKDNPVKDIPRAVFLKKPFSTVKLATILGQVLPAAS